MAAEKAEPSPMDDQADSVVGATEAVEGEALASIVEARDLFLESADVYSMSLTEVIDRGLAAHDEALTRVRSDAEGNQELSWRALSEYVTSVHETTIEPLRDTLRSLDLPSSIVRAWNHACASIQPELTEQLSKMEELELSAHVPFMEGVANAVAGLETGVVTWSREVLDLASAIDGGGEVPEGQLADSSEEVAAEQPYAQLTAAGQALGKHLQSAGECLGSLKTHVTKAVDLAASSVEQNTDPADQSASDWSVWFEHAQARLALSTARWSLFCAGADMQSAFMERVGANTLEPWYVAERAASTTLAECRDRAERLFEELESTGDIRQAIRGLIELVQDSTNVLDKEFSSQMDIEKEMASMDADADHAVQELKTKSAGLPETLMVHAVPEGNGTKIKLSAPGREVDLRAAASAAVDQVLIPSVSTWSAALKQGVRSTREATDNLQQVLRFYLGGAIEELRDASGSRTSVELRQGAEAAAQQLTLSGLDRALEVLAKLREDLAQSMLADSRAIAEVRRSFWTSVNTQIQAETAQAKLALQLETTADSAFRGLRERMVGATQRGTSYLSRQTINLYKRAKELVKHGHAVILGETDSVNYETTINALAELNNIRSRLPPVYRRLFSFHPLTDDSLMVGREEDIAWLSSHFNARKRGRTSAVVITSAPGSGITTFMNAARLTCLRRTRFCVMDLTHRINEESDLVEKLVNTLGLGQSPKREGTLVSVADEIMAGDHPDQARVCVIDRFEHLFLRKIGGFDLVARTLRLMSETASHVFWIATASDFAWQLLIKNEPLAVGLVSHYRISGYDRSKLEEVISQRHQRSALPITFSSPTDISPLLRRRVRKAESEEERQSIFRSEYFDALFAASGQNIMLAIFYWLLSVRYFSEDPRIQVRPLPQLDFELLAKLSVAELFALKAFLEHGTLTLEEYSELSNIDEDASFEVFESLSNGMIVERARDEHASIMDLDFERIERGGRYRVRPLLIQPIIRTLRAKNIVH